MIEKINETLKKLREEYLNKTLIFPCGYINVVKIFAFGQPEALMYIFVYDKIEMVTFELESDPDGEMYDEEILENQCKKLFKEKYDIYVHVLEKSYYDGWKYMYPIKMPKDRQQPIYE